jgi:sugar phosphate isomerase/epimerase
MQLGIFAKTFAAHGAAASLAAVRAAGYEIAHFNLAILGRPSMPASIAPEDCAEIAAASRSTGVPIAAVSATYNMIHPDLEQRESGMAALQAMICAAPAMGTRLVTLCTGTRHPTDQWAFHPGNAGEDAWRELVGEMARAVEVAEAVGVDLGIEPELANVVSSARSACRLMDELRSPRIRVVLDPANLFEIETPKAARDIVAEAVDLIGDRISMAHAKDRAADGAFVAAGQGIVDFPHFISRLAAVGFDGPLVTHGLSEREAPEVAQFLRDALAKAAA